MSNTTATAPVAADVKIVPAFVGADTVEKVTRESATTRRDIILVASEGVTGDTLLAALYAGTVVAHKRRESGTLRRWNVLKPGTPARKAAEALAAKVAEKGFTEATKSRRESAATLRRTLVSLRYTQEMEAASKRDLSAMASAANTNGGVRPARKSTKAAAKPAAPKASEQKSA